MYDWNFRREKMENSSKENSNNKKRINDPHDKKLKFSSSNSFKKGGKKQNKN